MFLRQGQQDKLQYIYCTWRFNSVRNFPFGPSERPAVHQKPEVWMKSAVSRRKENVFYSNRPSSVQVVTKTEEFSVAKTPFWVCARLSSVSFTWQEVGSPDQFSDLSDVPRSRSCFVLSWSQLLLDVNSTFSCLPKKKLSKICSSLLGPPIFSSVVKPI